MNFKQQKGEKYDYDKPVDRPKFSLGQNPPKQKQAAPDPKTREQLFKDLVGEFRVDTIKNMEWVVSKTEGKLKNAQEQGPNDGDKLLSLQPQVNYIQKIYNGLESQFQTKQKISSRDWIAKNQQEKPQTFADFQRQCKNWSINQVIVLEMWDESGDMSEEEKNYEKNFQKMLVNNMESVAKIFFRGCSIVRIKTGAGTNVQTRSKTYLQTLLSLNELEEQGIVHTRVRGDTQVKQFHAGQIFEYLKQNIKLGQHQCLLVLTNADLYPKEGWTFVFGMTKQSWRICIQSYARHHPNFADKKKPQRMFSSQISKKVQYRAIKTACHELSHVLSIRHCQAYECLMNGSSQLEEADRKPFALCAVCLRKLTFYLGFEGQEIYRYQELREVFKLMNHRDIDMNFTREIQLFKRLIDKLTEIQNLELTSEIINQSGISEKEGGNFEIKKSLIVSNLNNNKILESEYGSVDLIPLSTERSNNCKNVVTVDQLNRDGEPPVAPEKPTAITKMCQFLCDCFTCFQRPDEQSHEYNHVQTTTLKNKRKEKTMLKESHLALVQNGRSEELQKLNEGPIDLENQPPKIYELDSNMAIHKVTKKEPPSNKMLFEIQKEQK